MKVWAITLDVSTLNSTAFETVRGHWHVYLLRVRIVFDLTPRFLRLHLVLCAGFAVCG